MTVHLSDKELPPKVLEVLRTAKVEGNTVKLTVGKLDARTYRAVDAVLSAIGGAWKGGKVAAHVFPDDPKKALEEVVETGLAPDPNPFGFFATPPEIAARMVEIAAIPEIPSGTRFRVLEPSVGEGAIVEALRRLYPGAEPWCVEIDEARVSALAKLGFSAACRDFLGLHKEARNASNASGEPWPEDLLFDRVLMNPPFSLPGRPDCYVEHVTSAYDFLRPGGRLVAVCPVGFVFAARVRKLKAFREFTEGLGFREALPENAFRSSGTDVRACLVVLDRPVSR